MCRYNFTTACEIGVLMLLPGPQQIQKTLGIARKYRTHDISTNRPSAIISQIITILLAPNLFIRKTRRTGYVSKAPEGPDGSVEINVAASLIATS